MKRVKIGSVVLELVQGNIANQPEMEAVVNAANAMLASGGGVAGAIHSAAGPGLYEECRPLAPIRPGQAVITGAHGLPNRYVIHTLGPVYGKDKPEDKILAECYRNSLKLAEEKRIASLAFPAISTGIFGYPVRDAARVALNTVIAMAPQLKYVQKIRFVLYSDSDLKAHEEALEALMNTPGL
ncbi:Appr-1-p processing domain protein [Caldithrix abyssi DSM 13497]|uniref:Appr-1-p processing domain protein n=1 Tax=Caldithrix abyssi DSM 13497 TaxID=880073 RepID=H1XW45_CALAY|nr:macro domain-containing protein [Caldithrix abyssi]APF17738.1 O-acetyl-ADP-ribose deacetylase (regulator of RNase III), contains Macro domain [Caldithrix abyssi DSM 13497]EHO41817.1 Appr-1-p processing domain protein [Caldithrix abyssi DSM 13497]